MAPSPSAAEVTSMAPSPSATPNRTGVRIHRRCHIDRIFIINHHWRRRYNDRRRSPIRVWPRSPVRVWGDFLLIAWIFAIGSYLQIGGHCRRVALAAPKIALRIYVVPLFVTRSKQTREHVVRSMTGISNAFSAAYSNRDRPVDVE